MQNEILTFGKGYTLNDGIKTIIQSSKVTDGTLTVIGVDLDPETISYLEKNKCKYVNGNELAKKHNIDLSISPYTLKIIFFTLYCKKYTDSDNIFIADFTDVFFQKNIFETIVEDKVTVHSEHKLIKDCQVNSTWFRIAYGNYDVKDNEIVNSGTFYGSRKKVNEVLEKMCKEIGPILVRTNGYPTIDQTVMNKVIHDNPNLFIVGKDRKVFNLAHDDKTDFKVTDSLITVDGYESYVLHQYDVNEKLKEYIHKKYK